MNGVHVSNQFIGRKNRQSDRGQENGRADHRNEEKWLHPLIAETEPVFDGDGARREEHRVGGGEVVNLTVQRDELDKCDQEGDRERDITAAVARDKEPEKTPEPERQRGWIHNEDLLREELRRS